MGPLLYDFIFDRRGVLVLSKIEIAQYVFRHLSYTYTCVLSKIFFYKMRGTSSTDAFVNATGPALAVVSVGRDSPYGHPHAEVLARWRDSGAQLLTTAERGMVTVSTDGEDLRVESIVRP